jgi:DNA-binding transcriptional LysR family regulator
MEWLNYHHLLYFWTVVRAGSIHRASVELRVSAPPALRLQQPIRIVCREAASDQLLGRLATHELDVVLSDSPLDPTVRIQSSTRRMWAYVCRQCQNSRALPAPVSKIVRWRSHVPAGGQHCVTQKPGFLVRIAIHSAYGLGRV